MEFEPRQPPTRNTSEAEEHEPNVRRPDAEYEAERCNQRPSNGHHSTAKLVGQSTRNWP